jgi:hypothetical protein
MSLGGLLLGVFNIGLVVLILLLIGALILAFCKWINWPVGTDALVVKLYIGLVALIALYMLVALLLGIPTWRVVRSNIPVGPPVEHWEPHIIAPERHS